MFFLQQGFFFPRDFLPKGKICIRCSHIKYYLYSKILQGMTPGLAHTVLDGKDTVVTNSWRVNIPVSCDL